MISIENSVIQQISDLLTRIEHEHGLRINHVRVGCWINVSTVDVDAYMPSGITVEMAAP